MPCCQWAYIPRPVPCDHINGKESGHYLQPPGHCRDSKLKHTPTLLVKIAHLIVREIKPEDRFLGLTQVWRLQRLLSGNGGREITYLHPHFPPMALPQLIGISQKGAYTLIWSSGFYNCHPGDTFRSSGLEVSKSCNCHTMELYI